jgi:hypothetical protein
MASASFVIFMPSTCAIVCLRLIPVICNVSCMLLLHECNGVYIGRWSAWDDRGTAGVWRLECVLSCLCVCNRSRTSVQKSPSVLLVPSLSVSGGGCYKTMQPATTHLHTNQQGRWVQVRCSCTCTCFALRMTHAFCGSVVCKCIQL